MKKIIFFYIKKIKYGTHDTEKKETKKIFFGATILTMQFATSFYVFAKNKPRY